jgi:hypothetical protein
VALVEAMQKIAIKSISRLLRTRASKKNYKMVLFAINNSSWKTLNEKDQEFLFNLTYRGQFHQHFTLSFFLQKFCANFFVLEVKVKLFIGAKKMAQLRSKNVG